MRNFFTAKSPAGNSVRPGGWTLIELLVVVSAIMGMIAVLIPRLMPYSNAADARSVESRLLDLGNAVLAFRYDTGDYPGVCDDGIGLKPLFSKAAFGNFDPDNANFWKGPYVSAGDMPDNSTGNLADRRISSVSYCHERFTPAGGVDPSNANPVATAYTVVARGVPRDVASAIKADVASGKAGMLLSVSDNNDGTSNVHNIAYETGWQIAK